MTENVRGQYTQSDSVGDSIGTVRMPIAVYHMRVNILAPRGEYN